MNIKVSEVVAQYLDEQNLGQAEYAKAYAIAIRGWRELNWDIVGSVQQVRLALNDDLTVTIPEDCISINSVGVDNGDGGVSALTRTDNINLFYDTDPDVEEPSNIRGDFKNDNRLYPEEFSLGVGSYNNVGYFKIDMAQRQIRVKPSSEYSHLIIQYVSYNKDGCDYEINELASEALLAYISWKFSHVGTRNSLGRISYNRAEYYNQRRLAQRRIKKLMTQDLNQAVRESVKMAIKS